MPESALEQLRKLRGLPPDPLDSLRQLRANSNTPTVSQENEGDSLTMQFGKSAIQSALGLPGMILGTGAKLIPSLQGISNRFNQFVEGLTPEALPESKASATSQALAQTLGDIVGMFGGSTPIYGGAKAAIQGAAKLAPKALADDVLTRIANFSAKSENILSQIPGVASSSPQIASAIQQAPLNLAAGGLVDIAANPDQYKTFEGASIGLGLGVLDSLLGGRRLDSFDSPANAKFKTLPEHSKNIENAIADNLHGKDINVKESLSKVYQSTVRGIAPIENLDARAGKLAQLASGYAGQAEAYLEKQPFIFTADDGIQFRNDVKPLRQIIEEVDDIDAFRRVSLAAHIADPNVQLRTSTPIKVEDARKEVANASPKTLQAVADATAFRFSLLDIIKPFISDEAHNTLKSTFKHYVSLKRVFDNLDDTVNTDAILGTESPVRRFTGKKEKPYKILDPIISTIEDARMIFRARSRNEIGRQLLAFVDESPDSELVRKVPIDSYSTPWLAEATDKLKQIAADEGFAIMQKDAVELVNALYAPMKVKDNTITVFDKGQIHRLKVSPDIAKAYESMNPRDFNWMVKLLGMPANMLRSGVTLNPVFGFFNSIRDSWNASLNSKYGFKFGIDSWKGFLESLGKGEHKGEMKKELLAAGGGLSGITSTELNSASSAIAHLTRGKNNLATYVMRHPVEALRDLSRPFEEAARIGEYIKAKKSGATAMEAALASRNVSTDFSQIGTSMQALSYMTAFLNPAIQSADTMAKVFKNDPRGAAVKGLAGITIPTMLLWLANRNDQEINDLRKTDAGLAYWFVRIPGTGEVARIPKPFLYGQVFGTSLEAAMDKLATEDPQALERFAKGIGSQTTFNLMPTALSTYMSLKSNKDTFTGQPIVPLGQEDLTPSQQFTTYTTELSKKVSDIASSVGVEISPIKMDYAFKQTFGTLGAEGLRMVEKGLPVTKNKPSDRLGDMPFIGKFFARVPSSNVEPIRTFYDNADKADEVNRTMAFLEKRNPSALPEYIQNNRTMIMLAPEYMKTLKELEDIHGSIREINQLEGMDSDRKREMIDYLTQQMVEITRKVNGALQPYLD